MRLLLIFAFLVSAVSFAQHKFLDVPKLSEEDVASTKSKIEEDAPAEVLYRSYHFEIDSDGEYMYTDVVERVKIYKKDDANEFLNIGIMVYNSGEILTNLKATTYNMENGEIVATKVDSESVYVSTEGNYIAHKFAFPNVKDGSVVEYSYSKKTPFPLYLSFPEVYIEEKIPVKYIEFVLDTPSVIGFSINYRRNIVPKYRVVRDGFYQAYRYGYENIPAYKDELFVQNNDNYRAVVKAEVNSFPSGWGYKKIALSWNDVRKILYDFDKFGGQLKNKNLAKDVLPTDIINIENKQDRAAAILKFVQDNYVYNGTDDVITNKGVKNLITTKTGRSSEINLLLIMLLKSANIDANPVVLSTVENGFLLMSSPTLFQLNYVIAAFEDGGKMYFLDGTSKQTKINLLPPKVYNYAGILMTKNKSKQIEIAYPDISESLSTIDAKMNTDGNFEGHFSDRDTNLYALTAAEKYNENKEKYQKNYKDEYSFPFDNLQSEQKDNGEFETNFDFNSDTFSDTINDKIVFNPLLFLYEQNHDFNETSERKAPLEFVTRNTKIKKVSITLPENYTFENIPKSKKFKTENSEIQYDYIVTQKENKLTIETATTINAVVFPKEYYSLFKQMFDNITQMEAQVVTAVKK
ncbi:MAG: DUF3857 domain-containing protein [Flavobacteriaceae bacterium]|jgi:hypothetical protein|nr:DUF3857 domain-containing protein [Flavobacteriaceae bacterium]